MTTEPGDNIDMHAAMLAQLVMMFATSAMQHMGKMVNPMTQKAELDLEAAQTTIDMLDMLEAKTKGNLGEDEARMLKDTLSSLKLTYVEAARSEPAPSTPPPPAADGPAPAPEPRAAEDPAIETTGGSNADDKQPKFHKKYD